MKSSLTYFLAFTLFILSIQGQAQETDSIKTETILKVNPYGKGKTKWINSHGFKTDMYDWNDKDINLNLQQAIKKRKSGNIIGVTGATLFILNVFANALGRLTHAFNEYPDKGDYQPYRGLYYIGGTMIGTSLVFHISSESKLKKAKKKYELKYQ